MQRRPDGPLCCAREGWQWIRCVDGFLRLTSLHTLGQNEERVPVWQSTFDRVSVSSNAVSAMMTLGLVHMTTPRAVLCVCMCVCVCVCVCVLPDLHIFVERILMHSMQVMIFLHNLFRTMNSLISTHLSLLRMSDVANSNNT